MAKKKEEQTALEDQNDIFGELVNDNSEQLEDEFYDELEKKNSKLELFDVIGAITKGNTDYYRNLSETQQKKYMDFIILRFLANPSIKKEDLKRQRLIDINEYCNYEFFDVPSENRELNHLLFCKIAALTPAGTYHGAIKQFKSESHEFFKQHFSGLNTQELDILVRNITPEELDSYLMSKGTQDKERKKIISQFKKDKKL